MLDRFYFPLALALLAFAGTLATSSWQAMHSQALDSPPGRSIRVFPRRFASRAAPKVANNASYDGGLSRASTLKLPFTSLSNATSSAMSEPIDFNEREDDSVEPSYPGSENGPHGARTR